MLNKLSTKAHALGYFKYTTICELHSPCKGKPCGCESKITVIDFDHCKDVLCKKIGMLTSKSVDALLLSKSIYFIEIKGWRKFIDYNEVTPDEVKRKLDSFELEKKYADSLRLLNDLSRLKEIGLSGKEVDKMGVIKKFFVLVTDISPQTNAVEYIAVVFNFIATSSSTNLCFQETEEHILNFNLGDNFDFKNPVGQILIPCVEFDKRMEDLINKE